MILNHKEMRRWIAALRSGKYQQGKRSLHPSQTTYCCLGVACDISKLGHWRGEGYQLDDGSWGWVTGVLPADVREALGLPRWLQGDLVEANDDLGLTFDDIADVLELALFMDKDGCLPAEGEEFAA